MAEVKRWILHSFGSENDIDQHYCMLFTYVQMHVRDV